MNDVLFMIQNIKKKFTLLAWLWWYIGWCEASAFILLAEFDWFFRTATLWAIQCCDQTRIRLHSKVNEGFLFPPVAPILPVIAITSPRIDIIGVAFVGNFIRTSWNDKVGIWKCVIVFLFVFVWFGILGDRFGCFCWCWFNWYFKTIAIQDFTRFNFSPISVYYMRYMIRLISFLYDMN